MSHGYSVRSEMREGVEIFVLANDGKAEAEVAPALGNNCFVFRTSKVALLEPVSFGDFLKKPTGYGIPLLFPYPNRVSEGVLEFRGKLYPVQPNRHGYVRDKAWTVVDSGATADGGAWVTSSLDTQTYADQILTQFPFPFRIEVTYRLHDLSLVLETTVHNTGNGELPFGFGIHPYFRRPDHGKLFIPAHLRWELSDSLPTGNLLEVDGMFDLRDGQETSQIELDDIYTDMVVDELGLVHCVLEDTPARSLVVVESDVTTFPHIVAYTAPLPRKAICIEPYTCPTDGFNLQARGIDANLIVLEPGATRKMVITIRHENF